MISLYYVKAIIKNRNLIFWGVLFMAFWLVMGAFLFDFHPSVYEYNIDYTSTWFSIIALYSISTIGTTIAYSLYYSNSSLNFAFRFTSLTRTNFFLSISSGVGIVSIFLGTIMLLISSFVFSIRSHIIILPVLPYYSLIISVAGGIIMLCISGSLTVIINNYFSLKNINFLSLLTTILSYIFGFSQISISLPVWLVYSNPFSEIIDLYYYSFSGSLPHLVLSNPSSSTLNIYYIVFCLLIWILSLSAVFAYTVPKIRPVSKEEARQI